MNRNTQSYVEYVKPQSIFKNEELGNIYNLPENYQAIKENIKEMGIITPLIVNSNNMVIVSGNLRHSISIELGFPLIPAYFVDIQDDLQLVSLSSNIHRVKSSIEKYREMKLYKTLFGIKKGDRTDLNPELQKLKEERDIVLSSMSRDTRDKLNSIGLICEELYPDDSTNLEKLLSDIDNGKSTLNKVYKKVKYLHNKSKYNKKVEGGDYKKNSVTIYNKSSETMEELDDESVNVCLGSPVYWKMKVYQLPSNQLGQENTVEEYMDNLKKHYLEVYRVLRKDGSLFVNINDCCKDGEYQMIPQRFVLMLKSIGFVLNDELQWLKQNPRPTGGKRSVRRHEPIYHFVKSKDFYYNEGWLKESIDETNSFTIGTTKEFPKLTSSLDFYGGVLKTGVASTRELKVKCEEEGVFLDHQATFPLDVPMICLLMTSKPNDIILDNFNGTSVTGSAVLKLGEGRCFVGYEPSPEYMVASKIRLSELERVA
ncbi:DNA methyltransferase [Flavobacterium sp.]|jgi:site-specific DNA-methyltransferase (adenine-specific)|uniref:DNA methyltransferase n=1 Tax=Flavobacterium sp. TaxID=239 RepID=UPI0037C126B6